MENKPCTNHAENITRYISIIHSPEWIHGIHRFGLRSRARFVSYQLCDLSQISSSLSLVVSPEHAGDIILRVFSKFINIKELNTGLGCVQSSIVHHSR